VTSFIITSLIASVVLTIAVNALPRLFPSATERYERRIHDQVRRAHDESTYPESEQESGRKIRVLFPWKTMIVGSILLTVALNVIAYLAG